MILGLIKKIIWLDVCGNLKEQTQTLLSSIGSIKRTMRNIPAKGNGYPATPVSFEDLEIPDDYVKWEEFFTL